MQVPAITHRILSSPPNARVGCNDRRRDDQARSQSTDIAAHHVEAGRTQGFRSC
jgi:hypothetical protein